MSGFEYSASSLKNSSVSIGDLNGTASAITGGYDGHSLTIIILIVLFPAMTMYNSVELLILIFFTFNKYQGLYFWSLLIASLALIPYSLGFLLKFGNILEGKAVWVTIVLLTIGWYGMVTGQSVVLWSRLHLILEGEKGRQTLHWTKWMIITNVFLLHFPTTVLTFGSNGTIDTKEFAHAYNIMEKIQMSGFFVQEVILSSIYIMATSRIIKTSLREHTKILMWQLMFINIIIIIMDLGLLGIEAASLYLLETLIKGVIYSVKLKLEFAILGQLVKFVGRPGTSIANDERTRRASVAYFGTNNNEKSSHDTLSTQPSGFGPGFMSDFAGLTKLRSNNTNNTVLHAKNDINTASMDCTRQRTRNDSIRLPPGMTLDDVNFAMFQHTEDTSLGGAEAPADEITPHIEPPPLCATKSKTGDDAV